MQFTKIEAVEIVEGSPGGCPRCRWIAAGIVLRYPKGIDDSTISKASRIRSMPEPKEHD